MNNRFARIIVDISHEKLDKAFSYKIPENLMDKVTPGTQVMIPFGAGNKLIKGYVLECTDTVDFDINARIKTATIHTMNAMARILNCKMRLRLLFDFMFLFIG